MKKMIGLMVAALLAACLFGACADPAAENGEDKAAEQASLRIVATIFPEYDWLREIVGDTEGVELTLLLDDGVDLHSFQPTVRDIVTVAECDLFVYVGGESDQWVEDVLRSGAEDSRANGARVVVDLLDVLSDAVREEELVEGIQAEDAEEPEADEHVWLSLRNARTVVEALADQLSTLDPGHVDVYQSNAAAYLSRLDALDGRYAEAVSSARVKTLLVADRFPFRYLADDYGLSYYAAFAGCSAETEASFETILFLAEKLDELDLSSILKIESSDGSVARAVRDSTRTKGQQILTLDSLQSVTMADAERGVTYLGRMEENLYVLEQALQ